MRQVSRREALKIGGLLAAGFGLDATHVTAFADGIRNLASGKTKVLWLQAMSCTGCSISFLNSDEPEPVEILTDMISLVYHSNLSSAQGEKAIAVVEQAVQDNDFLLVVEGAIPSKMSEACTFGGRPMTEILATALRHAKAVIAAGTCAAFGGIPAAEGNATGAVGVREFMEQQGINFDNRLLNCPGCPVHPNSLVGTLAYVVSKGYPQIVPKLLTPAMFYQHSVHDECPRFHYWEKEFFAKQFGDEGCLFKLGCLGPLSHSTCPRRQWNGGINWCIRAAAPCIGCTSELFGKIRDFPFYRKGEQSHPVKYNESQRHEVTS